MVLENVSQPMCGVKIFILAFGKVASQEQGMGSRMLFSHVVHSISSVAMSLYRTVIFANKSSLTVFR